MATSYPGGYDLPDAIPANLGGGATTHTTHTTDHADSIEAIERALGLNPKGSAATVSARIAAVEAATGLSANSVTAAQLKQVEIWNPLNDGWLSFTPTITRANLGSGGTALGRYRRVGRTVEFNARITFGSAGSFNAGVLNVGLPLPTAQTYVTGQCTYQIEAQLKKVAATWIRDGADDSSKCVIILANGADALSGQVGRTGGGVDLPASPVQNTRIYYSGTYEHAATNTSTSLAS